MSKKGNITVIGADLRQIYMIKSLYEKGYTIHTYGINNDLITDIIKNIEAGEICAARRRSAIIN